MKLNKRSNVGNPMKSLLTHHLLTRIVLIFTCLSPLAHAAAATLSAIPDRYEMFENETLVLTVKYENGQSSSTPDFNPLKQSFDILGQNQSSQYVNSNGRVTSSVQWVLTLAPKSTGQLLIPPLSLQGAQSRPATLQVKTATTEPKGSEVVFMETSIDKKDVYVQEEFIVSLKLHFRENIIDANAEDFVVPGAEVIELNRSQYQTTLVHTPYQVIHLRFAVKPQASGKLEIPSFLWTLRTSASNNRFSANRSTLHRVRTEALSIDVKPKPASYPANAPWLPAKALNISESWSQNPPAFTEGEPVTRNIIITARGLSGEQLPPLDLNDASGAFKYYPDQPKINSDNDDRGTTGSRQESYAMVPSRAGSLTLPAVEVTWWDTTTDQLRIAKLPERTLNVATGKSQQTGVTPPKTAVLPESFESKSSNNEPQVQIVEAPSNRIWQYLSLGSLLLNLALAFLLILRFRTQRTSKPSVLPVTLTPDFASVIHSAKQNMATETYSQLLKWLKAQGAHKDLQTGFRDLGADNKLMNALRSLDQALYSKSSSSWQGDDLAQALQSFRPTSGNQASLKLYPSAA